MLEVLPEFVILAPEELDTETLQSEPGLSEATRSLLHFTSFFLDLERLKFLGCFGGVGLSLASKALSFVGTESPDGGDNSKLGRTLGRTDCEGLLVYSDVLKRGCKSGVVGQGGAAVGAPALFAKTDEALKLRKSLSDSLLV